MPVGVVQHTQVYAALRKRARQGYQVRRETLEAARAAAFGSRTSWHKTNINGSEAHEGLPTVRALNKRDDGRCIACSRVNHNVAKGKVRCTHCNSAFNFIPYGE
jgi:hypothetical protein